MLTKEERDEYRENAVSLTTFEAEALDDLDAKDAEIAALQKDFDVWKGIAERNAANLARANERIEQLKQECRDLASPLVQARERIEKLEARIGKLREALKYYEPNRGWTASNALAEDDQDS